MKTDFMDKLYNEKKIHAYVIKAIEGKLRDFELRRGPESPLTYAALWHDENIMTLTGEPQWCKELFEQYYGVYNYYDIDPGLMDYMRPEEDHKYTHEVHHLMHLETRAFKAHPVSSEVVSENLAVRKAKKMKREVRYHLVEPDGRVLGSVLIEEATAGLLILSEFIVKKPFRGKGLGGYFVNQLIQTLVSQEMYTQETDIVLYVDETNVPAKKLYEKVGFKTIRMLENLILNEDD